MKARRLTIALAVMAASSCVDPPPPVSNASVAIAKQCPAVGDDSYFFRPGSLIPTDDRADYQQRQAVNAYLSAAGARSLSCGEGEESYRIFWGAGHGTNPVVVTVSHGRAEAIEFVPPDKGLHQIAARKTRAVTEADVLQLGEQIGRSSFWTARPFSDLEGEGTVWVVEVRRGSTYKVVTRVRPDPALAEAGRLLLRLAGLAVPEEMTVP